MGNDWILDVLADLKAFAARNDLSALADQLDHTSIIAQCEIASNSERAPALIGMNAADTGMVHRAFGCRKDA